LKSLRGPNPPPRRPALAARHWPPRTAGCRRKAPADAGPPAATDGSWR